MKMKLSLKFRFLILLGAAAFYSGAGASLASDTEVEGQVQQVVALLADGKQSAAEDEIDRLLKNRPEAVSLVFFKGACLRSRFQVGEAVGPFLWTIKSAPASAEGIAAACILGIDFSADTETALAYLSGLAAVQRDYPGSVPIQWMSAVMTRSLTTENSRYIPAGQRTGILSYGVRQYDALLQRMAPRPGPVLVHQTYANILDSLKAFDEALVHRKLALPMERKPWSLDGMADTLRELARYGEALEFSDEALAVCIKDYQKRTSSERAGASDSSSTPEDLERHTTALRAQQEELLASYHSRRGSILYEAGNIVEGASEWLAAFAHRPTDPALVHYAGWRFYDEGKWEEARKCLQQALALKYNPEINERRLRRIAVKMGEPGASAALTALDKSKPESKSIGAGEQALDPKLEAWFLAAVQGDYKTFQELVNTTEIDVRTKGPYRQTALMLAAQNGDVEIVGELLKRGAEVNAVDANGDTALHYTAQFHQPRVMKILLEAGADPNIQDRWKQTALISSAGNFNGFTEPHGVRFILEKGADLEKETPHIGTALHYAAGQGAMSIVRMLLSKGAKPDSMCRNSGATPLLVSAQYAHPHVSCALLEAGANVNARDKEGRTALHFAVQEKICQPLYKLILSKGGNPTLADRTGMTPIRKARLLGFEDLALEMEKVAGQTERFDFAPSAQNEGPWTLEEAAFLASLPVALVRGHFPEKGLLPKASGRNEAKSELVENFGIQNAGELKAFYKNDRRFEPRFEEKVGRPGFLLEALDLAGARKPGEEASVQAWVAANQLHAVRLGREAGLLKAEEAEALMLEKMEALRNTFSSWNKFVVSFLTGAAKHRGWEFDRYSSVCRSLVEAPPKTTPWTESFWKGAAAK